VTDADLETPVVVAAKETVADGVVSLTLRDPDGAPLPGWEPGAHIDLRLTSGLERQYSLCGDPSDRHTWRLAVLHEPGGRGGSAYVHDELRPGTRLVARGPRNHFRLVPAARYLFIAGGIGITPILPMLAAAQAAGADWRLLYGGRRRRSMAFLGELAGLRGDIIVHPQDESGLLDLAGALAEPRDDTAVYCCGPEPLLAAVEERCSSWPRGALHVERFVPKPSGEAAAGQELQVVLARSGLTLSVPAGTSVLQAVEDAGVGVLSSCREGTCGTCETTVLEGIPDHRDSILTGDERDSHEFMMICVSRSRGPRLVLDL
jgi:ferredoxin-NADP reductase